MAKNFDILETVREDDFVEYFIFPKQKFEDTEVEIKLNNILNEINQFITKYTCNYLWHRDEFKLKIQSSCTTLLNNGNRLDLIPQHFYGISHYGDNIEDEWFIVYLLIQITKNFDGFVARVVDVDGEFLLIETADFLPTWANPDNCDKRVYICNGLIHIVVPDEHGENTISVSSALTEIYNNPSLTVATKGIQTSIANKIKNYPEKIKESLHRVNAYLPVGVAAILKHKPSLISLAVQAFCNRDTIDMKACRAMKYFPPEIRVRSSVTFTKCLYAMLSHSKYLPDKKTGWNLPTANSLQYKAHSLGVKIACGFEILMSHAKNSTDIEADRGWHAYVKKLEEKQYFKDLMKDSKEYNTLMNKAKEYYINHCDSMHYFPVVGQEILNLTKSLDYNVEELNKAEANLPPDDDETWLNVSPEDLDKMLQEQYGRKKMFTFNDSSDTTNFTEKVSSFLHHISDVEGAEFPNINDVKEKLPIRPPRGNKRTKSKVSFSSDTKTDQSSNKVNFDPSSFTCAVQSILNFVIPEDDSWDFDSDSDMSDYEKEDSNTCGKINKMQQIMEEMDKELAKTTIGENFRNSGPDHFEDIENFKPVDIDVNTLKNILESYRSQMGEAGPSSNMLGPMGIHLDTNHTYLHQNGDTD